jgi:hypothetical protein
VRRARSIAIALEIAAISLITIPAAAEDRQAVLDAPAPPTLPALAHPSLTYTFEYTAASIDPKTLLSSGGRASAWFAHNELELPLQSRKWYLGAAHDIAAGAVPGVGHRLFFGNPEIWGRGLWSSVVGLSSGAGLGVVLPLPRRLDEVDAEVLQTVRVVRPWDASYFNDRVLTVRPWFDIRHIVGRFMFQFRQGLDVTVAVRPLKRAEERIPLPGGGTFTNVEVVEHRMDFVARATLYLGFRATKEIGLGMELWEVYQVSAALDDDKRASVTLSPSIRFMLGRVAPAISMLIPLTTPLRGEAASYYAARLNVAFDFDAGLAKSPSK